MCLFIQVFVANPNKAKPIQEILLKNKEKVRELCLFLFFFSLLLLLFVFPNMMRTRENCDLEETVKRIKGMEGSKEIISFLFFPIRLQLKEFLENFHTDRSEDEQFNEEKKYLIKQINDLK